MPKSVYPQLQKARKQVAMLQEKVSELEVVFQRELASLHESYGFVTVEEFTLALEGTAKRRRRGRPPGRAKATTAPTRVEWSSRMRARITEEMRAQVKKLVEAGKTGTEIAKAVGVSLPSVQNIKKALGLVKSRQKSGARAVKRPRAKKTALKAPAKAKAAPKKGKRTASATKLAKKEAPAVTEAAPVALEAAPATL